MKARPSNKIFKTILIFIFFLSLLKMDGAQAEGQNITSLVSLLTEVRFWKLSEAPETYLPETLFEYINGAAEIYLIYDFRELIVAQYEKENSSSSLTAEIYDMGNGENSFGIYSVERFPDSNFLSIGNGAYVEEGALNFIVGKYYIKLLCFDCGGESDNLLKLFSQEIVKSVEDKGHLPPILGLFPKEGLAENSEKFILRNFMGYSFLHDGYIASYKLDDLEFDCFIIEGKDVEDAQRMMKNYLERYAQNNQSIQEISLGYHLKDSYYLNIFLAGVKKYICGVRKIKNDDDIIGERYLEALVKFLKK